MKNKDEYFRKKRRELALPTLCPIRNADCAKGECHWWIYPIDRCAVLALSHQAYFLQKNAVTETERIELLVSKKFSELLEAFLEKEG